MAIPLVAPAAAQQQPAAGASSGGCSRGTPHRECSAFWLTETGFAVRVTDDSALYPSFQLGRLINVGSSLALGATGFVGYSDDDFRVGLKPRIRVWVGADTGVDIAAGLLCCADGYDDDRILAGDVGVSFQDRVAVVVQVERKQAYRIDRGLFYDYETWVGGKIGSRSGLIAGAITAVVGAGIIAWVSQNAS